MKNPTGRLPLATIVAKLEAHHGARPAPPARDPFALVCWENVAYLADDEKRAKAFARLKAKTGLSPKRILEAAPGVIEACCAAPGRMAAGQADKLRAGAEIAVREFDGDLGAVLDLPPAAAIRALKKFPSIGEPGAQKILLFAGRPQGLALESNGLRALTRLGFGKEDQNYARMYKSVQEAVAPELSKSAAWLQKAHLLLRTHGQAPCTRSKPDCPSCPFEARCPAAASGASGWRVK
jgi:endonuclease III